MPPRSDPAIYHALPITDEALANGGVEILRAGLIDDELFVTARHAFKDPAPWGQVLADITRRLAQIYSLETDLTEAEALAEIEEAYAADLGAAVVETKPAPNTARAKAAGKSKATKRKAAKPEAAKLKSAKPKAAKPKAAKPKAAGRDAAKRTAPAAPAKRTAARTTAAGARKPAPRSRGTR